MSAARRSTGTSELGLEPLCPTDKGADPGEWSAPLTFADGETGNVVPVGRILMAARCSSRGMRSSLSAIGESPL